MRHERDVVENGGQLGNTGEERENGVNGILGRGCAVASPIRHH